MDVGEDILTRALRESMDGRSLIGIHSNSGEPDDFTLGWITGLSPSAYVIVSIDRIGRRDEIQFGFIEDIFQAVVGGHYIETLSSQMINYPLQESLNPPPASFDAVLDSCRAEGKAVFLYHRNDTTIRGFIRAHDEAFIEVDAYSQEGLPEGQHVIRKEHVARVAFDGPDQRALSYALGQ